MKDDDYRIIMTKMINKIIYTLTCVRFWKNRKMRLLMTESHRKGVVNYSVD